ncbi:ATP-binding protein [Hymenobacter metallicola]|uniref:histidine kinase n=1 Tax=Hymenobacter metallicola TaxID=2563114 RepID=A0A4Z0QIB9_9BACT|nr:ATP-binding protein [Hymenobacter metallicola]TGE29514.1 tetratricopeptide repeat protein [Hymenobacter metallicola]
MTRFLQLYRKVLLALGLVVAAGMEASARPATEVVREQTPPWQVGQGELALANRPVPLNPEARLQYGQRLLQQASRPARIHNQALGHRIIASAHQELRHYNRAVRHFRRALQLHRQLRNRQHVGVDLFYLGGALLSQGDTGQARQAYQAALQSFGQLQQATKAAQVQERLGNLYSQQGKWAQALASQARALQTWQHSHDSARVASTLTAIGNVYHQQRHFSRALFYLHQALQTAGKTDSIRQSESLAGMGRVYLTLGNDEAALNSFRRAVQLHPVAAAPVQQANLYQLLAATHDSLGHWAATEQTLLRSLPIARRGGSKAQLNVIYKSLASLYRRTGNYKQALEATTHFAELQDSLFADERSAQVAELRTRYETEKKEREIQLLTKDRQIQDAILRRQKLLRNALATGALLLLIIVAGLYRGRQQQQRINRLLERKNTAINRQKEELGRLNRTKDTLFSVISHDLRSPLSSLYALLNLLNMGALPPERLALHSARLTRGLNNTLLLLDNLLNWSAAQIRDDKIRPERLRLDVLTEEAVALLLADAERKGIQLLNQLPVPLQVRADINMVRLVLRNLLGNALKFTPEGGRVTVSAARQGAMWAIAIQDTGVGIPAAAHDKVFGQDGAFSTLGTAREKGTGLGLQLCKDFVERNGGQLSFISEQGQGTTFTFTLPAAVGSLTEIPAVRATEAAAAE